MASHDIEVFKGGLRIPRSDHVSRRSGVIEDDFAEIRGFGLVEQGQVVIG